MENNNTDMQLLSAAEKYIKERFIFNDETEEAIITKHLLINTIVTFAAQFKQQDSAGGERDNRMRECFKRLVGLKKHKDEYGKTEYYERHQPIVWKEAFEILAGNGSILREAEHPQPKQQKQRVKQSLAEFTDFDEPKQQMFEGSRPLTDFESEVLNNTHKKQCKTERTPKQQTGYSEEDMLNCWQEAWKSSRQKSEFPDFTSYIQSLNKQQLSDEDITKPIGEFILAQKDLSVNPTESGYWYHYADVCTILNRFKAALNISK